jgi:hypothetical protein
MKEREMKIVKEMIKSGEGNHRCSGKQALVRLSIKIPNEDIKEVVKKLEKLSIIPQMILKSENEITIDWWAMNWQIIFGKKNYLQLVEEFLDYVEGIGLNRWTFNSGCLFDDLPFNLNHKDKNLMLIVNPKFTVENFNNTGEITIRVDS